MTTIEDWENFTKYCYKCGRKENVKNKESDLDVYQLTDTKFIPLCQSCFNKLPDIPENYLENIIDEDE